MTSIPHSNRHIDLDGAVNIRDLGGYPTSDGRSVCWKTILRADNVGQLPPESQDILTTYGVRTVIDLRHNRQIEERGNVFSESPHVNFYHQPMLSDETPEEIAASSEVARDWFRQMEELDGHALRAATYCMWLDTRQEALRKTLSTLAAPGTLPALFHCHAGKDRTGIMAILVLGIAGVRDETIVEDYELSAYYRWRASLEERSVGKFHEDASPEDLDATGYEARRKASPAESMCAVLEYLKEHYGGIEDYVRESGVTDGESAVLRTALVE